MKYEETRKPNEEAKKNILEDDVPSTPIWLVFGFDKIDASKPLKPVKIALPKPWKNAEDELVNVCLITKDPHQQYKEVISGLGIKSITKVIGVSKLRTDYKPFEVRRQLCNSFDVFLADERVLPLLPKLLGKTFFDKKKLPIAVDLTRKPDALKIELVEAIEATALTLSSGPCTSVKVGISTQSQSDLKDNVSSVITKVVSTIPGGWKAIRTIHLKSATSLSLPLYAPEV